jgi:hypothetical protein
MLKLAALAGPTVTGKPVFEMLPSLTVMVAEPALYSVIAPLLEPDTVATPLVKLIAVAVPKAVAVPELFVTVGENEPIELAPPNVRLWDPV